MVIVQTSIGFYLVAMTEHQKQGNIEHKMEAWVTQGFYRGNEMLPQYRPKTTTQEVIHGVESLKAGSYSSFGVGLVAQNAHKSMVSVVGTSFLGLDS